MTSMPEQYDVVIVGAGPAGSSAAIRLANAGRKVLLIDKCAFPRHKLCGEFVSPECLDDLHELGVLPEIEDVGPAAIRTTVFYSRSGRSCAVANKWLAGNEQASIAISRRTLDQILLTRARESGAEVLTNTTLTDVQSSARTVTSVFETEDGAKHAVFSSIVIDATGRGRYVARRFDARSTIVKPSQVAFKIHLRGAVVASDTCEIYSFRGGYGGCTKIENELFNLCFIVDASRVRSVGSDLGAILEATVFTNAQAARTLAHIEVEGARLSVPIARYGAMDPTPAPCVLAIGDAAAFIDPFTGSGIAMALDSSRLACESILKGDEPESIAALYRRAHAAAFVPRLRFCRALRYLSSFSWIADAIIVELGTSELLRRSAACLTRSSVNQKQVKLPR